MTALAPAVYSVLEIQRAAAIHFGVTIADLKGPNKTMILARMRSIAMYVMRKQAVSYPAIGRAFNRDHTTALSACRRIAEAEREGNIQTVADLACITTRLQTNAPPGKCVTCGRPLHAPNVAFAMELASLRELAHSFLARIIELEKNNV